MMEAARSSERSVYVYQIRRRHNSNSNDLCSQYRENFKYHYVMHVRNRRLFIDVISGYAVRLPSALQCS